MKVLIYVTVLSDDGSFGGPTSVARAHAKELSSRGHDVMLIGTGADNRSYFDDGFATRIFRGRPILPKGFTTIRSPQLLRWLRREGADFDVAHLHFGRHLVDAEAARALVADAVPIVLQTHGMLPLRGSLATRAFDRFYTSPAVNHAQLVLTLTDLETDEIRAQWPKVSMQRIRNAVPVRRPVRNYDERSAIVFIARLHPRKRVLAFAEAAALQQADEFDYVVYGPDEGDLPGLLDFMASHPAANLSYRGPIRPAEVIEVLAKARALVLPSRGEVFPMTVLEALSTATPVIISDDCGISPALTHAGAAITVDGSPRSIAAALERLVQSPDEWDRFSSRAHEAAENEFSLSAVVTDLIDVYESAQGRSHDEGGAPWR